MKRILFFLLILVAISQAQDEVITVAGFTHRYDSTSVSLTNSDTTYIFTTLPNRFDYVNNTSYKSIVESTAGTKPSSLIIPYSGENYWNGGFYIGVYPTFSSGALDSFRVAYSPIDNLGNVFTNDVRHIRFSDGTSSTSLEWKTAITTGSALGASSNGETVPVCGYRFTIVQHATSCASTIKFKIWKY